MARPSVRKKPTNKEMASAIIEINNKVNEMGEAINQAFSTLRQLDAIVGMYVDMSGKTDEFNEFIIKKQEELKELNDAKRNENTDTGDIPEDSEDEGSGSERVREKSE
tara:strand:+ start:400 stop:723 length:324 start_codon:yes stop_codon:yes gene_type:complete